MCEISPQSHIWATLDFTLAIPTATRPPLRPRVETGLSSENSGRSDQDDARWRSSGNYFGLFPVRLAKGRYGTKPWVCVRRR